MNRRHFLAGTALLPLVAPRAGRAAERFPRRLVVIVTSNGVIQERFWPAGGERDFAFPEDGITAPLASLRRDLLLVKGIDMKSAADDKSVHGGHDNFVHLLVGGARAHVGARGDHNLGVAAVGAGDVSVDQHIARMLMPPTRFPVLTLGVMVQWGTLHQARVSWLGDNRPVTPLEDPYRLFDGLFGGTGLPAPELERLRRRRRSVLDLVGRDLEAYGRSLGSDDRARVAAHLDAIRTIERQLDPRLAPQAGRCAIPTPDGARIEVNKMPNFPAVTRLQMDLAATALACDLTRIVTLQLGNACNNNVVFSWLGDEFAGKGDEFPNREHHDITHVARRSPDHVRRKVLAERWFVEQFAYFLHKLRGIREGDGTLLDHSVVLFANNMHDGAKHSHGPHLPWILAGGHGHLATGRFVDLGDRPVPHQRVLASLCEYMGVDPTGFGTPAYNAGPLAALRG